ncbi:MAG: HNH endonuclease [Elusimicrobia bacterium]|nr:HNH endonuclease [Elusimicrobiota bacterium]
MIKEILISVYNNRCQYCGLKYSKEELHIEHIIPRSKEGKDELQNYTLSCKKCNYQKRALILPEPGLSLLLKIAKEKAVKIEKILDKKKRQYQKAKFEKENIKLSKNINFKCILYEDENSCLFFSHKYTEHFSAIHLKVFCYLYFLLNRLPFEICYGPSIEERIYCLDSLFLNEIADRFNITITNIIDILHDLYNLQYCEKKGTYSYWQGIISGFEYRKYVEDELLVFMCDIKKVTKISNIFQDIITNCSTVVEQ